MQVVPLISKSNNAKTWGPLACAEDLVKDLADGSRYADKLLVLSLDERDGVYKIGFAQAGMKASEMLALVESFKMDIHEMMGR